MSIKEKIKRSGGFIDFGAVGSMPLGYYADGAPLTTSEYYEAKGLISSGSLVSTGEKRTNEGFQVYLTRILKTGDLYQIKGGRA